MLVDVSEDCGEGRGKVVVIKIIDISSRTYLYLHNIGMWEDNVDNCEANTVGY